MVACNTPSLSQVPRQITRSLSLRSPASILFTFLLPCSWLVHSVELSYITLFSTLEPLWRTVSMDLSLSLLITIPSHRAFLAAFSMDAGLSCPSFVSWANANIDIENTSAHNSVSIFFNMCPPKIGFARGERIAFTAEKNKSSLDAVTRACKWAVLLPKSWDWKSRVPSTSLECAAKLFHQH